MSKKVFELAKELDMGAIDLVDKLRNLGLQVRNHMATLSKEDVDKALAALRPASSETSAAPKKAVRRKATPATTAALASGSDKETVVAIPKSPGVVTVKRKATKESDRGEEEVFEEHAASSEYSHGGQPLEEHEHESSEASVAASAARESATLVTKSPPENATVQSSSSVPTVSSTPTAPSTTTPVAENQVAGTQPPTVTTKVQSEEKRILRGLRVVSMPEAKRPATQTSTHHPSSPGAGGAGRSTTIQEGPKKEYLKSEKMFSFTPVYTPPPIEKKPAAEKGRDFYVAPDLELDQDARDKADSKKRLGGLAAMVAKPKGKVRDITQIRADEELKTYTGDLIGRVIYRQVGRKKIWEGPSDQTRVLGVKEAKRVVNIHKAITAEEFAHKLKVSFKEFQAKAMGLNLLVIPEDYLGPKLCEKVAALYNYRVEDVAFDEKKILGPVKEKTQVQDKDAQPRNPIITIMGHVDHGKTTLLDTIRKTKVAAGEAGGITQHIGAYSVKVKNSTLTFLDTPGHAAFASMRQRGANVTDVVILVVAADDGVMPQTRESIKYAQNAGCPIIVAVNKVDKEGANPDRIKQALMEYELTPEEWGGQTQYVLVSALKNQGIDHLLESIALQAEIMDLRANPNGMAQGVVIESKVETGRGPMATVLVQTGTLSKGDYVVVGETMGRARSLNDASGVELKAAGPSTPVQILGLSSPPNPGDLLNVVKNEREANKIVENRINERKALASAPAAEKKSSLEDFFKDSESSTDGKKILKLIVRSDVQGSFEAIKNAVGPLGNNEVSVQVIGGGVGPITDTDVQLANSSKGYIIGFNMRPVTTARKMAEELGVDIKSYTIIYQLIDDVTKALEGLLEPEQVEVYLGRAEVRDTFNIPKIGMIAGSAVIDGKIQRGCQMRLLRDGKIIYDGKLSSLKRFKDDVREVQHGYECGIALENYNDVKAHDVFEAYMMEKRARKLDGSTVTSTT